MPLSGNLWFYLKALFSFSLDIGKANIEWPGLNKPLELDINTHRRRQQNEYVPNFERRKRQFDPSQRGWSGTTWPGRHAGAPEVAGGVMHL